MSLSKKIIYSILVAIALGLVLFSSIWLGKNYGKIEQALDGVSLYTSEDLDKAYNDGKEDGLKEKQTYLQLIEDYKLEVLDVESKLTDKSNAYNKLESQYFSAVADRDNYKSLLDTTTEERDNLQIEYDSAVLRCENLSEQLSLLQNEIDKLSLNLTNAKHRIAELEANVNSNDEILDSMISENQVIARFYVKNIVYSIQVLDKSSIATVSEPVMSENEIFLGWTINNEVVDVSAYPIEENTVFIAKINDIYDVNFISDDVNLGNYKVISGCYSDVPESPTKDGYEFDGWSVDNMVVDVSIYPITSDVTFVAKFTKIHTVTFEFKGQVDSTQKVRNGGYASSYTPNHGDDCRINYWTLNGVRVDVDNYCITSDVTFVCNYTNIYKVKFVAESQEVTFNILENEYPSRSAVESDLSSYFNRENYVFDYWMNDSSAEVDPFNTPVTSNITYTAHFSRLWTVRFLVDDNVVSTQIIKNNEYAEYVVVESTDRKEFKSWTAYGSDINVSNYRITEDIDFVARVTIKYLVQFSFDNQIIQSSYLLAGAIPTIPDVSSFEDFSFNYWTTDGSTEVDVSSYVVSGDVIFIANIVRVRLCLYLTPDNSEEHYISNTGNWYYVYPLTGVEDWTSSDISVRGTMTLTNGVTYELQTGTGTTKYKLGGEISCIFSYDKWDHYFYINLASGYEMAYANIILYKK